MATGTSCAACRPRAPQLKVLAGRAAQCVEQTLQASFGEAQVAHRLAQLLPLRGQLFVGNSLIVRWSMRWGSCLQAIRYTVTVAPAVSMDWFQPLPGYSAAAGCRRWRSRAICRRCTILTVWRYCVR